MIKHRLVLAAVVVTGALAASVVRAEALKIETGDRPYFHGQSFWENDWEMVWVSGHWSNHHHDWVHGHYKRGQYRASEKHDKVQEDRDRHDNHQFDDARRHHRPRGS